MSVSMVTMVMEHYPGAGGEYTRFTGLEESNQ